jgi:hypothetical protein
VTTTLRRQLPLSYSHPTDMDHVIELANLAADFEDRDDFDSYVGCVHEANTKLNRAERMFFAGIVFARRVARPC